MASDVTLSITVLSYNNEQYIVDCLQSIVNQGISSYEVFVIDDCSTDDSVEVIKDFIKDKPEFTLIEKDVNTGGAFSSQIGVERSTGKYCAFIDSDDILADGAYKRLISRIETDDSDFAAGMPVRFTSGYMFSHLRSRQEKNVFARNRILEGDEKVRFADLVYYWNCVYKTDFIKSNKISMPGGLLIADRIFIYLAVYKAKRISVDTGIVYYWRAKTNFNKLSITDKNNEYPNIADRCNSFEAQIRITLENSKDSNKLNLGIWERSLKRLYYPLNDLLGEEKVDKELVRRVCERYRVFLKTFAGFFLQLVNIGKLDGLSSFYTINILDNNFDNILKLAESDDKAELLREFVETTTDVLTKKALIRDEAEFSVSKIGKIGDRLYIYVQTLNQFKDIIKIEKVLATTRHYYENTFELEYDNIHNRFDISDLPETSYQFIVVYTIGGERYMGGFSKGKNISVPTRYEGDDYIVKTSIVGGNPFHIMKKNRFFLRRKDGNILLYVNQDKDEIKDLFFYNVVDNKKTILETVGKNLYKMDTDKLSKGRNMLLARFNNGICSVVNRDQFIKTIDLKRSYKDLFVLGRIEIDK